MKLPFTITRPLAFFDLETTGTNPAVDRIVQLSIMKVFPDGSHDLREMIIDPQFEIPKLASDVHGITQAVIDEKKASGEQVYTFQQVARPIRNYLIACDVVAYNGKRFDVPMLCEEFIRAGITDWPEKDSKLIDPYLLFTHFEERTLKGAYKFYCGKVLEGGHDAQVDTLAMAEVLIGQIEKYSELQGLDLQTLADFIPNNNVDLSGKMVKNADGKIVFSFGKHKDKLVYDIFNKVDPGYYNWLMRSDFTADSKAHFERLYQIVQQNKKVK